jgi:hypothetical protein
MSASWRHEVQPADVMVACLRLCNFGPIGKSAINSEMVDVLNTTGKLCDRPVDWKFYFRSVQRRIYGFWCPGQDFQTVPPPDGAQSGNLGHSYRERTVSSFFGVPSLGALDSCPSCPPLDPPLGLWISPLAKKKIEVRTADCRNF